MAEVNQTPRVLAIHAHPDDIEFQCAGTLALLQKLGCPITMITMSPGDKGSAELDQDEIAEVRRNENRASAALLGAEYRCLEFRDLEMDVDNRSRQIVTEAIRRVRPEIVITAPPVDYMTDHEVTSRLVRDACFCASVPNYRTHQGDPAAATEHVPHLYYVDPLEGIDNFGVPIEPHFIVDTSSTHELKIKMLACHESQRNWLRQQHGVDEYLDACERWSVARGRQIGVAHGEGFRQHKGHPYPQDNIIGKLLGLPEVV